MQAGVKEVILITSAVMDMAIYAAWIYVIWKIWKIWKVGCVLIHIKNSDMPAADGRCAERNNGGVPG